MGERATIDQDYLYGAADAIRRKNGTSNTYTPAQFEAAIDAIPTGGGGGATILSGTSEPTAGQGANGNLYLLYAGVSAGLPSDATPVSYIKNVAGQYIRTGYSGNDNSEYKIIFKYDTVQASRYPHPFGGRRNANALGDCSYVMFGNSYNYNQDGVSWGSNQYIPALSIAANQIIEKIVTVELSAGSYKITFDGQTHTYTFTPSSVNGTVDMGIFTGIFGNAYNDAFDSTNMRLYGFEIRESGSLVHKYVPCLDSNNIPCVYDTVGEAYLYNSGSGNFTYADAGEIMNVYVKSSGAWKELIGANISEVTR